MFYNTPDVRSFVTTLVKYRWAIIGFYLLLLAFMVIFFKPQLVSSEELFWLSESKALEKTQEKSYQTKYLSRLTITLDQLDQKNLEAIQAMQKRLMAYSGVLGLDSLLEFKKIYNDVLIPDSALVKSVSLKSLDAKAIRQMISLLPQHYLEMTDKGQMKLHFYIYAKKPIYIKAEDIGFSYVYSQPNFKALWSDYFIYIFAIVFSILLLFRTLFKNYVAAMVALLIVTMTLMGTIYLNAIFSGMHVLHLSTALIVISISLVDYLYFYYRWHVSQYKADVRRAMKKTINRNLYPAMWTSIITVFGLGALLFVDSTIIRHLSMSVIGASILTYLLNLTLLPALLSFFKVKHPRVGFAKMCYAFAQREMHFNVRYLKLFLIVTLMLILIGAYQLSFGEKQLFTNSQKSGVITAKLPLYELDLPLVKKISQFEKEMRKHFSRSVKINSVASVVESVHKANYPKEALNEAYFMEASMFMQLYGLEQKFIDKDALRLVITFDTTKVNKSSLLEWMQHQKGLDLYLTDVDSLVNQAKESMSIILAGSLFTALLLIGLIMSRIFRSKEMILVGFMVNAIPIAWFGVIIFLLGLPLTIEALIAMTIALALGSDATVHFAYKYFRGRYFGRTQKHSLEIMFFYAGIPVIIGSLILATVFISLTMTSLFTLQLIGAYGAMLMIFSLATDLFVLPVMLLAFDRFFKG